MATDRRSIIVPLLILTWLILSPEPPRTPGTRPDGRPLLQDVIQEETRSLSVLQNSSWHPAFGAPGSTLNLTGLLPEKEFAWTSLPAVKARVLEQTHYALGDWADTALQGTAHQSNPVALYSNVTGYVRGGWKRSKIHQSVPIPQLNLTEYAPLSQFGHPPRPVMFGRNITGDHGHVTISFSEKSMGSLVSRAHHAANITDMSAELQFVDDSSSDEFELQMYGVYFLNLGQAILTTTSDKFAGIFTLPHLALSERTFEASRALLNASISTVIQRQRDHKTESLNPWISRSEGGQDPAFMAPECDLVVYLQQMAPISSSVYPPAFMTFLERELRFPTGAVLPSPPDLHFSMLAFSPDCGFVLESDGPPDDFAQRSNHLAGPKMEVQYRHSRHHLLAFTFALAAQLFLLMRQMREASTPSTRSRISFYTIAAMALGDGFTTMTFLLISLFIPGLWVSLVGTGFLAFISVSFFGMRFLMDIWQVQAPERERRAREEVEEERRREEAFVAAMQRLRARRDAARMENPTPAENTADSAQPVQDVAPASEPLPSQQPTPSVPGSFPPPATVRPPTDTGATPVFMPSDQEGLEPVGPTAPATQANTNAAVQARMPSFASLYTRFYLILLMTLFLSLNATSWPALAQRVYFTLLALMYLSFWVPQILRNVHRNCRHALNWEFVLGHSVFRLVPFLYFYGYEHNVLFTTVDYYGLATLVTWIWIQVVILASQELIGPRWFVRRDWAPPAYDYHPILREDEEGATMPIGLSRIPDDASAPPSPLHDRNPTARRASVPRDTKEKGKGKRTFDCAICMQDLEVAVIEAGGASSRDTTSLAGGLLARRAYMVTPCRHIFHSTCLEGWMKYRLQCPNCRETLPPL